MINNTINRTDAINRMHVLVVTEEPWFICAKSAVVSGFFELEAEGAGAPGGGGGGTPATGGGGGGPPTAGGGGAPAAGTLVNSVP